MRTRLRNLPGLAPANCPSCSRPLPPETDACPYCGEPAAASWRRPAALALSGAAMPLTALSLLHAWPVPLPHLPATPTAAAIATAAIVILLDPFRWPAVPPAARRERLAIIMRRLGHRFGFALLAAIAVRVQCHTAAAGTPAFHLALAGIAAAAAAALVISSGARRGFLAGMLLGCL